MLGYIIAVVLFVLLVLVSRQQQRIRKTLEALTDALEERRPFLRESHQAPESHLHRRAQNGLNTLLDDYKKVGQSAKSELKQIETTLGQLQEAVLMINHSGIILSTNPAAMTLFNIGAQDTGKRIHPFIRSTQFLDYMSHIQEGGVQCIRELNIEVGDALHWFEVSGLCLPQEAQKKNQEDKRSEKVYLFVLHDITRLKNLENLRREFVANVSHELRTPVTIIKGFSDTLIQDHERIDPKEQQKFLKKIHRNVDRLNLLLEDLLALSRLESDRITLNRHEVPIQTLFDDAHEMVRHRLGDEQRIIMHIDPKHPTVYVDELKFSQVFNNLLDNAIRYAKAFDTITLSTEVKNDSICFSIKDNGCGIPQKDLPHLFERFYRVDKGRSRENGGTGLGLSIVKHIILMHGGEVYANSELGKSTEIHFCIPIKPASTAVL